MRQFTKNICQVVLSLTAAVALMAAVPVQAAPTASASGPMLLAQNAEPKPEKAPSPAAPKKAAGPSKPVAPPASPKMEKMEEKNLRTRGAAPRPMPGASGTKKMGGQTIRDKESPEGE